jgi:hypothetical protein
MQIGEETDSRRGEDLGKALGDRRENLYSRLADGYGHCAASPGEKNKVQDNCRSGW